MPVGIAYNGGYDTDTFFSSNAFPIDFPNHCMVEIIPITFKHDYVVYPRHWHIRRARLSMMIDSQSLVWVRSIVPPSCRETSANFCPDFAVVCYEPCGRKLALERIHTSLEHLRMTATLHAARQYPSFTGNSLIASPGLSQSTPCTHPELRTGEGRMWHNEETSARVRILRCSRWRHGNANVFGNACDVLEQKQGSTRALILPADGGEKQGVLPMACTSM